jgi:molecular chaperone DnaK
MARLGIDFGTTNTIAVLHDRGMFTEVRHAAETGAGTVVQSIFPSAILIDRVTGERWFGIEAERRFGRRGPDSGHVFIGSLKRRLRDYVERPAGNGDPRRDDDQLDLGELLADFLGALGESIRSSLALPDEEALEAVITWPANANGAQRHITRKCYQQAGFDIIDTLNEPTASAIELGDCLTAGRRRPVEPHAVAVFDLGGGTFDASVVWIDGDDYRVLDSGGIEDLGGDDFDAVLLNMFLKRMKVPARSLSPLARHVLLRQARGQKETISAGTVRSMFLNPADFGLPGRPASISVEQFYERIQPLLEPALDKLRHVVDTAAQREPRVAAAGPLTIYLVGGSSMLPLVADMVSRAFPHGRVVVSDKPFCSVALGAAICATDRVSYRDVFARHFGLIRLRDHGQREWFDTIFPEGTPIPRRGEPALEKTAWYHPQHNIGHLRYLECTDLTGEEQPGGNVRAWSDILFPYDPATPMSAPLRKDDIVETDVFAGEAVCETYRCDTDGVITVEISRPASHDSRTYEIFRD